jgi:hypothetical protein
MERLGVKKYGASLRRLLQPDGLTQSLRHLWADKVKAEPPLAIAR